MDPQWPEYWWNKFVDCQYQGVVECRHFGWQSAVPNCDCKQKESGGVVWSGGRGMGGVGEGEENTNCSTTFQGCSMISVVL